MAKNIRNLKPRGADAEWVSSSEAAAVIGREKTQVYRLAEAGHIRMHRPGGLRALFYKPDCVALSPEKALETANP